MGCYVPAPQVLRTFRVLRPLVAIKRFKKTKLLLDTLFSSMFRIMDVMYILLAFVLFMGVVGVELFQVLWTRSHPCALTHLSTCASQCQNSITNMSETSASQQVRAPWFSLCSRDAAKGAREKLVRRWA